MTTLTLVPFNKVTLAAVWQWDFQEAKPEWKTWDAPYFDDYHPFATVEDFLASPIVL